MMDTGQLLERFRLLSREIQNGIQTAQKQLEPLKRIKDADDATKVAQTLGQINEAWQDFSGWILLSTLEDTDEARANCAPGRLDIHSKITRSKIRRVNDTSRNGIGVDMTGVTSIVIETYIPYFEQLLDLIFANAVKYSPKAGSIEITTSREKSNVIVSIRSIGPTVQKTELDQLGIKGFRAENARKLKVTGQGYGLFNAKRLADLLYAKILFRAEQRVLYESSGVQYSHFTVQLIFPEFPHPTESS